MITYEAPRGTRQGPIIFFVIVNRLSRHSPIHVKNDDDSTMMETVDVKDTMTFTVLDTLDELTRDCAAERMYPNPFKCEVMLVCPPKRSIVFTRLMLNGRELPIV